MSLLLLPIISPTVGSSPSANQTLQRRLWFLFHFLFLFCIFLPASISYPLYDIHCTNIYLSPLPQRVPYDRQPCRCQVFSGWQRPAVTSRLHLNIPHICLFVHSQLILVITATTGGGVLFLSQCTFLHRVCGILSHFDQFRLFVANFHTQNGHIPHTIPELKYVKDTY